MNRFKQADATQGASNPVALTNTLKTWMEQILEEKGDFTKIRQDPACRLLVYQLAFLFGVDTLGQEEYEHTLERCEALAEEGAERNHD